LSSLSLLFTYIYIYICISILLWILQKLFWLWKGSVAKLIQKALL